MKGVLIILVLSIALLTTAKAQKIPRFNPDTVLSVTIDSPIIIRSTRLTAQSFIDAIMSDTSFYKAFREMSKYSFIAENRLFTYNKKNRINAKIYRQIYHDNNNTKHQMKYLTKQDSGQVYRHNGKYQLYTAKMFDYIFMNANNTDFIPQASEKATLDESYKDKLKTLIFSPGKPIKGIPFIGSKTQIFTPTMRQYYNYSFDRGMYSDSIPIYRFKISQKPELANSTKNGLMIKELTTVFDLRNFQILGRYIDMKYDNLLLNFDVQMNIELNYFGNDQALLPTKISYQGNWDIPFKKEERASFLVLHKEYQLAK